MADIKGNTPPSLVRQRMLQRKMQLEMTTMQSKTRLMELDFEKERVDTGMKSVEEELAKLAEDLRKFDEQYQ